MRAHTRLGIPTVEPQFCEQVNCTKFFGIPIDIAPLFLNLKILFLGYYLSAQQVAENCLQRISRFCDCIPDVILGKPHTKAVSNGIVRCLIHGLSCLTKV